MTTVAEAPGWRHVVVAVNVFVREATEGGGGNIIAFLAHSRPAYQSNPCDLDRIIPRMVLEHLCIDTS